MMSGIRQNDIPRVLLVAAANSVSGGGERHVADLMRRLPEHGIEVVLAAPGGGDLGVLARELEITTYDVPIASGLSWGKVRAMRNAIDHSWPDLVHAHGSRAAAFARLADPHAAERVIYTLHGIHIDKAGSALRRSAFLSLERYLRPKTALFITVDKADVEKGERLGILRADHTSTVHNGIELPQPSADRGVFRQELGIKKEQLVVLSIGRFHEQKDQITLLEAFARVSVAQSKAVLVLMGSGPLEPQLREKASALGLERNLKLVAPRASLAEVYTDADLFALSSRWEGLPYVVLEAMAYGLPVVATNVDGIPEAVEDGVTGVLVPPGDPKPLGREIVGLLRDKDERAAMGAAGRTAVERFELGKMVEKTVRLYRLILGLEEAPPVPDEEDGAEAASEDSGEAQTRSWRPSGRHHPVRRWADSTFIFISTNSRQEPGGVEERWLGVMKELLALGATVHYLCFKDAPTADDARELGVTVAPYLLDKWNVIRSRSRLRKYLRRYEPVCVHSTGLEADAVLRWAVRHVPDVRFCATLPASGRAGYAAPPVDRPALPPLRRGRDAPLGSGVRGERGAAPRGPGCGRLGGLHRARSGGHDCPRSWPPRSSGTCSCTWSS